jgi:3-oxoacyl-[acyl-carrier protein] reductase
MTSDQAPLASRVALVTGAGRNIGRAIALELASAGADVLVNVHTSQTEAEQVATEIRALGRRAIVCLADVRDEASVRSMMDQARQQLGPVTILVNNAAIRPEAPFDQLSLADWHEVLGIVLDGAFICTQAALPHMLEAGWGRIVNIAGLSGQTGAPNRAHVVAGKAGLIGLTKALALEYAACNITVNAVSPGVIDTERKGASAGEPMHRAGRAAPVGRRGTPTEVAAMVAYLVSTPAAYVTGQTLNVNGGLYL